MASTFVIAEAGVNHNGDIRLAKKLIDVASECRADAVKFQTFDPSALATTLAKKADYQIKQDGESSQHDMLKRLALKAEDFLELKNYCESKNILFMSSPFDLKSVDLLAKLNMSIFKIPSGEITNLPLLRRIGSFKKRVVLSTGMATMNEISDALVVLEKAGTPRTMVTVLQCTTEYPAPPQIINLNAMKTIAEKFQVAVGYSDHTQGIEVSLAAVAAGATVIEKHYTLDRNMPGPDHKASLEPSELKEMIRCVRNIELAMGSFIKEPSSIELKNLQHVRKSIVAAQFIKSGEVFSEMNLTTKRPADGLSPMKWDSVIGQRAKRDYQVDEFIEI